MAEETLKSPKILRCPLCRHELTRKIFQAEGKNMVGYVCDVMGMSKCRYAVAYIKGEKK